MAEASLTVFERSLWGSLIRTNTVDLARLVAQFAESESRVQVVVETVFTDNSDPLEELSLTGVHEVERLTLTNGTALRLVDSEGEWVLLSLATRHQGVFHLLSTVPRSDGRWQRVERWVSQARMVSRCYLNHDDFLEVGDRLSAYGPVEIVKVSARMVGDGSSVNRGFPARNDSSRPSHRDEMREIESLGAAIRNLTVHVPDVIDIHLRRLAGATFYGGRYLVFRDVVLERLEEAAATRRALVTDRARKAADEDQLGLSIALPDHALRDADDTGEVIAVLEGYADLTLAVFHRNPYLHFAVTDESDGSNFDVLVTREDSIDIFPGYRSSSAALARVAQRLGEAFGAVSIQDLTPTPPVSLADLV
jgi:hypothetical protein